MKTKERLRIQYLTVKGIQHGSLRDFNLQIFENEIIGLVGLNGAGKSTLAKVLSGNVAVEEAHLTLNGSQQYFSKEIIPKRLLEANGIYVVDKEMRFNDHLSVADYLTSGSGFNLKRWLSNPRKKDTFAEALLKEYLPEINPATHGGDLSPISHSMVCILKYFGQDAKLIMLHNIFEMCHHIERIKLLDLINRLKDKGLSFIVSYNKLDPFLSTFDKVAIIRKGIIVDKFNGHEYDLEALAMTMTETHHRDPSKRPEHIDATEVSQAKGASQPLLQVRHMQVENSLSEWDFNVYPGEILGIYNSNNEKIKELFQVLVGIKKASKGGMTFLGKAMMFSGPHEAIRAGIGIVSEKYWEEQLYPAWTIGESLFLGHIAKEVHLFKKISSRVYKYFLEVYPEAFNIDQTDQRKPAALLTKEQQFLMATQKCLLVKPKVMIFENPVQSADLMTRQVIYEKINEIKKSGCGVILISKDLSGMVGYCDSILLMQPNGINISVEGLNIEEEKIIKSIL